MKKKLTVNTLALGNIKNRKKQYTIMIIGIILAMVFSSSIVFLYSAAQETNNANYYKSHGYETMIISAAGIDESNFKALQDDKTVESLGTAHILGYAYNKNESKSLGSNIAYFDENGKNLANPILLDGKYPQNKGEVAIEKTALSKLGYKKAKIGDTITFQLDIQNDCSNYYKTVEKKYKLVGILQDKKSIIGYTYFESDQYDTLIPAILVSNKEKIDAGGKEMLAFYVKCKTKNFDEISKSVSQKATSEINDNYVSSNNSASFDDLMSGGDLAVLLLIVLILASCVAIVNSFNNNLKDRRKQIGMLRAIGTTKRQIINIFGREAFIISLICVPISLAISYFTVSLLLKLAIKDAVMSKSLIVLPVAAVINEAVVMLAALIPLISASKTSPMQAIRNVETARKFNKKRIKTKKEYNPEKLIAKRNLGFYKGSKITVCIILMATILLSNYGWASVISSNDSHLNSVSYDYELLTTYESGEQGINEAERQDIEALPYIGETKGRKTANAYLYFDKITDFFRAINYDVFMNHEKINNTNDLVNQVKNGKPNEDYENEKKDLKISKEYCSINLNAYDEAQFKMAEKYVADGKINYSALKSGDEIVLIAPKKVEATGKIGVTKTFESAQNFDKDIGKKTVGSKTLAKADSPYKAGDKITFRLKSGEEKTVKIGAIIHPYSYENTSVNFSSNFQIATTIDGMRAFDKNLKYNLLFINASEEVNDKIDEEITEELSTYTEKYGGYLNSIYENHQFLEKQKMLEIVTIVSILIICFAVSLSIINNAMSARIRESKREIGTLRAVGADERALTKSFINQMTSMFTLGIGIGFGLYILSFVVIKIIGKYLYDINLALTFNPLPAIIISLVLFLLCSINLWVKVRKEMKNSIVENIREL